MSDSSTKTRISDAMKAAMRAKEKERLATIRLIMSEFKRFEVDERKEVDDVQALVILDKMLKQRRDSIEQFEKAGRNELAAIEAAEITVIQSFMPAQLGPEEIAAMIDAAVTESGAEGVRDMGKVMAILKPQLQGRADLGKVSGEIKRKLAGS
ncbi:MAG: GatB/YqeY domain-containing protein [Pseudomonadales bacterium]